MSGKVDFAVDFINVLSMMNLQSKDGMNPVAHAAALLFLIEWGLNTQEVDEANKLFWQKVDNKTIEPWGVAIQRIATALANRDEDKKRFMRELAAIADFDDDLTENEANLFKEWGEILDFKPSEVGALFNAGAQLAYGLNFFGKQYRENMK